WSGAVSGEAIITGSRNGRLRARQARLRCLRAPEDRRSRRAICGAAMDVRSREAGAHVTAGLVSHLDGGSKLFVRRTSAAVVFRFNNEFKSTALRKPLRKLACHWNPRDEKAASCSLDAHP